jgi:hypothetical protein
VGQGNGLLKDSRIVGNVRGASEECLRGDGDQLQEIIYKKLTASYAFEGGIFVICKYKSFLKWQSFQNSLFPCPIPYKTRI